MDTLWSVIGFILVRFWSDIGPKLVLNWVCFGGLFTAVYVLPYRFFMFVLWKLIDRPSRECGMRCCFDIFLLKQVLQEILFRLAKLCILYFYVFFFVHGFANKINDISVYFIHRDIFRKNVRLIVFCNHWSFVDGVICLLFCFNILCDYFDGLDSKPECRNCVLAYFVSIRVLLKVLKVRWLGFITSCFGGVITIPVFIFSFVWFFMKSRNSDCFCLFWYFYFKSGLPSFV